MNEVLDVRNLPNLPKEAQEQFLAQPKAEIEDAITAFILDFVDKQTRKKRRDELFKNLSPEIERWAGVLKKSDGNSFSDGELDQIKYDYLKEKYG